MPIRPGKLITHNYKLNVYRCMCCQAKPDDDGT